MRADNDIGMVASPDGGYCPATPDKKHTPSPPRFGQRRFEDPTQIEEVIELRWLANIPARAEPRGVGFIPFGVRRAQNNHRYMTAPLTHAHLLQYLAPGLFRKVEVHNGEVGAGGCRSIYGLDKLYRLLAVRDDDELAFNAVLFQGAADQTRIRGIILHKKNANLDFVRLRPAVLRRARP
jgi:hypothetical protein